MARMQRSTRDAHARKLLHTLPTWCRLQPQPPEQLHHLLVQALVSGIHTLLPGSLQLQLLLGQLKVVHLEEQQSATL